MVEPLARWVDTLKRAPHKALCRYSTFAARSRGVIVDAEYSRVQRRPNLFPGSLFAA